MANWVQEIEKSDEKGDTKAIYKGVQALSGKSSGTIVKPTMRSANRLQAQHTSSPGSEVKVEEPTIASFGSEAVTDPDVKRMASDHNLKTTRASNPARIESANELV